jgi:hypothetical protein
VTTNINCTDCQDRLAEFALDELDARASEEVSAHLAGGCAECNRQLTELVESLALVAEAVPRVNAPASVGREVFARIAAERDGVRIAASEPSNSRQKAWLTLAASLAAATTGVAVWLNRPTPEPTTIVAGWAEVEQRILAAQQDPQPQPRLHLRFVSRETNVAPDVQVTGEVIEDQLAHQLHVYIQDLPPIAADREFRLWLVMSDGGYVPAGSIRADAAGNASALIDLPSAGGATIAIGLSDESVSAPQTPSPNLLQAPLDQATQ